MSKTKRLALFLPSLHGGGAERVMLTLAEGFAERGLLVDLVLASAEGPYLNRVPEAVHVVNLGVSRVIKSLPGLVRYLRREQPQALLSALDHANLIALVAKRLAASKASCVVSVHSTLSVEQRHTKVWRARFIPWLITRWYPGAKKVVTVSQGVAEDLIQTTGLAPEKIQVIYNPVVIPDLLAQAQAPIPHPWLGADQPPVILGIGRLTAQKDFPTLIRAFARVREQRLARLIILGEGEERPKLEALIRTLNLQQDVALPGFVHNPYAYMGRAAVFVLSSAWEGFGNVLVEAMAVGTPVVATDCPSGPAEILHDRTYGPLVGVGDDLHMAKAMMDILEGRGPTASVLRGRAADFSLEAAITAYLEVLNL
ncbi:glycosyl transferase group 1 [Nitrosococcus halophilus Nc 4]|uniref:Glycosyl transferase group 1 n=1 Tax=Nitrosococcus halophilus (strain Nc4) TaxID=472759 RepID=D5BWZ8_NITHN|nr:glycosyltransferase [Nitrosococcus halophilus]ADE13879.1 glycosyl transferase group 1 [Nitrosococcus halophilus Nc 4]